MKLQQNYRLNQNGHLPILLLDPVLDGVKVCQQGVQLTQVALQGNAGHPNLKSDELVRGAIYHMNIRTEIQTDGTDKEF